MTRFKSANVAGYVDFKTTLAEFLRKIDVGKQRTRMDSEDTERVGL